MRDAFLWWSVPALHLLCEYFIFQWPDIDNIIGRWSVSETYVGLEGQCRELATDCYLILEGSRYEVYFIDSAKSIKQSV